jgi:D-alanyl-D-alanine carboxypeptidase/D-alanyl-D-alanine-endopeptidase (penicillin-binding protein 4)
MKLLTSGTALLVLGRDFVFRTEVLVDGSRVVLKGSGDPALGDPIVLERSPEKMTVERLIAALAGAVKKAGIDSVSEVIVDDRIFDREFTHPTWPKDQLDRWYCAEVAGFNFHTNVLSAFPKPAAEGPGHAPGVDLEPAAPWLEIENKARTVAAGKNSVWLSRDPSINRFTMFGEVRAPTRVPVEITIHDPPTLAGQLIAADLLKAGVSVGGVRADKAGRDEIAEAITHLRLASAGEDFTGRTVAAVTTSLEDVLARCNGDSHNLYAEAMIKRLGHDVTREPGSWTNGSSVVRMTIAQELGADAAATTVIADGSGMSREDRVSPRTLTRWLERLQRDPTIASVFIPSLATTDSRESLKRRFRDVKLTCNLHAKTGTIDGVRCLSGYLIDPATERKVVFSVMVNGVREGEQALSALQFHEDVVALVDRWIAAHRPGKEAAVGAGAHKPSEPRP